MYNTSIWIKMYNTSIWNRLSIRLTIDVVYDKNENKFIRMEHLVLQSQLLQKSH